MRFRQWQNRFTDADEEQSFALNLIQTVKSYSLPFPSAVGEIDRGILYLPHNEQCRLILLWLTFYPYYGNDLDKLNTLYRYLENRFGGIPQFPANSDAATILSYARLLNAIWRQNVYDSKNFKKSIEPKWLDFLSDWHNRIDVINSHLPEAPVEPVKPRKRTWLDCFIKRRDIAETPVEKIEKLRTPPQSWFYRIPSRKEFLHFYSPSQRKCFQAQDKDLFHMLSYMVNMYSKYDFGSSYQKVQWLQNLCAQAERDLEEVLNDVSTLFQENNDFIRYTTIPQRYGLIAHIPLKEIMDGR